MVMFKIPKIQQRIKEFEGRWDEGVLVVSTPKGVFKVSTIRRMACDKRWSAQIVKYIIGSPEEPALGGAGGRITRRPGIWT